MKLIQTQTLTTAQPDITFSAIPQNFTDLVIKASLRTSTADQDVTININSSASNFSNKYLFGNGSTAASGTAYGNYVGSASHNSQTANTFGNIALYFPNYAGSTNKSYSSDAVNENNATTATQAIIAGLWSNTAAINAVKFLQPNGANFVAGSTISLYGIGGAGDGYAAPKATGGVISYSSGYIIHTFFASGTFTPTTNLTDVEYLVVAGGGGSGGDTSSGGPHATGGGGAGGYRSSVVGQSSGGGASAEARLSLTSGVGYTVTIGAGGTAGTTSARGGNGVDSTFASITSTGGGGGSMRGSAASTGGSGGGGASSGTPTGAAGTVNQGFAGGNGTTGTGGGGGGAGGAGGTPTAGIGVSSNITGSSIQRAIGGTGGGGTAGTSNTGDGGDGVTINASSSVGQAGGSGIVIVRYAA